MWPRFQDKYIYIGNRGLNPKPKARKNHVAGSFRVERTQGSKVTSFQLPRLFGPQCGSVQTSFPLASGSLQRFHSAVVEERKLSPSSLQRNGMMATNLAEPVHGVGHVGNRMASAGILRSKQTVYYSVYSAVSPCSFFPLRVIVLRAKLSQITNSS